MLRIPTFYDHRNAKWQVLLKALNTETSDRQNLWRWKKSRKMRKAYMPHIHEPNNMTYTNNSKVFAFADTLDRQFYHQELPDDAINWEEIVERSHRHKLCRNYSDPIRLTTDEGNSKCDFTFEEKKRIRRGWYFQPHVEEPKSGLSQT